MKPKRRFMLCFLLVTGVWFIAASMHLPKWDAWLHFIIRFCAGVALLITYVQTDNE